MRREHWVLPALATGPQNVMVDGHDDVVHVAGGVLAWVREIEPDKPVY